MSVKNERLEIFRGRMSLIIRNYIESEKLAAREELAARRSPKQLKKDRTGKKTIFESNRIKAEKAIRREAGRLIYTLYVDAWMGEYKRA